MSDFNQSSIPNIQAVPGNASLAGRPTATDNSKIGPSSSVSISGAQPWEGINPLSYAGLIKDFNRFRAVAQSESDPYDMPGRVFFRVVFHFINGSDVQSMEPGIEHIDIAPNAGNAWTGLIAPSWLDVVEGGFDGFGGKAATEPEALDRLWRSSTAFNYFVLNNDLTRARYTREFIELLSNISTESPWYFQNIKGLESAIERSIANQGEDFQFKDERNKITIECLDDSYDQRIGTLLDLYRAIVWSWETKRIMLPANLRKFDMTIIAFQMPLRGKHISRNNLNMRDVKEELVSADSKGSKISKVVNRNGSTVVYTQNPKVPAASFKAWEFHGCEFDYNSSKSGYSELDNAAGSVPKYSIDIMYDDVFETRFNEFMDGGETITDVLDDNATYIFDEQNLMPTRKDTPNVDFETFGKPYEGPADGERNSTPYYMTGGDKNMYGAKPRRGSGLLNQLLGAGEAWVGTKLKKIYLGNMNGLSISKITSQVNQALNGDIWATINNAKQYARGDYNGGNAQLGENIFKQETTRTEHMINLGNIFRTNTALES